MRFYVTNPDSGIYANSGNNHILSNHLCFSNSYVVSVYLLASAIVMLATNLHNITAKKQITKKEWLEMNHSNNTTGKWDDSFLLGIYH